MIPITQDLLTSTRNRPFLRDSKEYSIRQIRGVIAHWTANTDKGAHAKANRNYFNNTQRYASAHYIVDDKAIIQCLPDNEVGYHVGGLFYKPDGKYLMAGAPTPNYFLIGFEMCVNSDGVWSKTYQNSVDLAAHLLRKYAFTIHDLYRHFDITGKDCPKMMIEEPKWAAFKADVAKAMLDDPKPALGRGIVTSKELNVRSGPATTFPVQTKLVKDANLQWWEEKNGWLRIGTGRWVSKTFVQTTFLTKRVRIVSTTGANVRNNASGTATVIDAFPNGAMIFVTNQNGDWLEVGINRWTHNSLTANIITQIGEVVETNELNVRQGPGTDFKLIRKLNKGNLVEIFEEKTGWYRIAHSEWVFAPFIVVK